MKHKIKRIMIFSVICIFCFGLCSVAMAETDDEFNKQQYTGPKITKANFPDKAVRKAVKQLDDNGDGICSIMEQKNIGKDGFVIKVSGKTLNFKGISKLKYIREITINGSESKKRIHLTNDSEIGKCNFEVIYFESLKADKLIIQGMKKLKSISNYSGNTDIKKIIIRSNPKLKTVSYGSSETMICGKNKRLKTITVDGLKKIDIKQLKNLKNLSISGKKLKSVDVSNNKKLVQLHVDAPLNKIDVSKNKKLKELQIENMKIKKLNLSNKKTIKSLLLHNNSLKKLNCSKLENLESLECTGNQIKSIDLSSNKKLNDVTLDDNRLANITFGTQDNLGFVYLKDNQLTSLDLSNLKALYILEVQGNQIQKLDFSKNTEIDYVECDKSVEVTGFTKVMKEVKVKKQPNAKAYISQE